ncbi:MAG: hypothetical protein LBC65_06710, partial [Oscillospiraceae bacterium]|nr:hypothetical protein [Oscillospiraceae bacterium]
MKLRILAILAAFTLTLAAAQHLLTPKYVGDVPEGAFIAEYYRADADNSVIVLGSSKAYSAINPVAMFNSHGVTSYVRAAPEQRIWQSLYVLEDTLKRETPQVVVLDILEMYNGEYSSEAYNRLNLEGLRDPLVKAYAALESGAELSDGPGS